LLVKNRNPFLAAVLSILLPGLGQLYGGRLRRSVAIIVLALFLNVGGQAIVATQAQSNAGLYASVILLTTAFCLWVFAIVDAVVVARRTDRVALAAYNRWYVYAGVFAASVGIVSLPDFLPIPSLRSYSVPSGSMQPTLLVGDLFEAATQVFDGRPPSRGDLVVFKRPGGKEDYVKRIVALPGDRVQMRDGVLYLNDAPVLRERLGDYRSVANEMALIEYRETLPGGRIYQIVEIADNEQLDNTEPVVVPAGSVFVLGDNRDRSTDSRVFGPVPFDLLRDKPFLIYWSRDPSRIGMAVE
jgi:signal peptidase I